jgi:hypothetical protein
VGSDVSRGFVLTCVSPVEKLSRSPSS